MIVKSTGNRKNNHLHPVVLTTLAALCTSSLPLYAAGSFTPQDDLPGGGFYSEAFAVNADGSVVVGTSDSANGYEAFRWTQTGGMVGLGDLPGGGFYSEAFAVSADGSVVVGVGESANGYEAFRWAQAGGMVTVADWLTASGVTIAPEYTMQYANGVSADGKVVVGRANGPNGFEAFLAREGSGAINPVANTQNVIEAGVRTLQTAVYLPNMVLFGAHHRTILDNGLMRSAENNGCAWATGDFGRNYESDAKMGLAEMGICKDLGTARIGIGFGLDWAKQDLNMGGEAKYNGQHVLIEAANAFKNGLQPSIVGYYGRFDADVSRHYQNAGNLDSSHGSTEATSKAIRLRLDWKDLVQIGSASITPYAAYTWMRTNLDGYTETGGGFPVQYDNNHWTTNDVRLGAAAYFAATTNSNVRIGAEFVHRFEDNTASGKVLGLNSFSYQGKDIKQSWVRATADLDHRFTDDMLVTVGLNAGTGGGDNNWGVTAGLRANF
ncbi:MAG TPA: autotransporter domain-containing protein [Methylotenera sp.]|nr:autotransporter domain-containing protein [Methylotenera sp.]HPH04402.1 autotransporter domain-containing protein [Methylotenera sp.]HPM99956.1 autotransporter domain-containing protein [Methylotenera sp.]